MPVLRARLSTPSARPPANEKPPQPDPLLRRAFAPLPSLRKNWSACRVRKPNALVSLQVRTYAAVPWPSPEPPASTSLSAARRRSADRLTTCCAWA